MITHLIIEEANFHSTYKSLAPLFREHWEELGEIGGSDSLSIDYGLVGKMYDLGIYKLFTLRRSSDDYYIGYAGFTVSRGLHTACNTYAMTDVIYIDKDVRNSLSSAGHRMLRYCEKVLKDKYKVDVIQFNVNCSYDISKYIEKCGYKKCEIKYSKRL